VPLVVAGVRQLQQYGSGYRGTYNEVNNPQAAPVTTLSGGNGSGGGGNSANSTANASNSDEGGELLSAAMFNSFQSMPSTGYRP
jgi:hypothetical protein